MFWDWSRVKTICIDGKVVSTSDPESVGPGSIPGGRKSFFFSFFLLEVIKIFSSFQSRVIYQNKSKKVIAYHINVMNNPRNNYRPFSFTKIPCTSCKLE